MAYQFVLPKCTVMGENALLQSRHKIEGYGKKALIVTGKIISASQVMKELTDALREWKIEYYIFDDIIGEPTDVMIEQGVKELGKNDCDFIIGIGGGSPLDSAKAIAALSVLKGNISDYLGEEISGVFLPFVLIPTTAGTGSEATRFTVITDSERGVKMLLKGDALLPDLAIVDAAYSVSSPPSITAATGMDALTHAIESYTSRKANVLTDLYAVSAIQKIFQYLPRVYADGRDMEAREQMALAAYEAGICINNASVTLVHGMSRPIGALFHVPHGISNAMLLTECLSFAAKGCSSRMAALGRAIGVAGKETTDQDACDAFLETLKKLCITLEIPTLREYGIEQRIFECVAAKMARDAIESGSPANTIRTVTEEDILSIYQKLF